MCAGMDIQKKKKKKLDMWSVRLKPLLSNIIKKKKKFLTSSPGKWGKKKKTLKNSKLGIQKRSVWFLSLKLLSSVMLNKSRKFPGLHFSLYKIKLYIK